MLDDIPLGKAHPLGGQVGNKPTLRDVARRAGVAVSTASVVLNSTPGKFVSETLRDRVLQAARQLDYLPNIPARRMRGKRGRTLAILVPQFDNFFFNRVVIGAESYASAKDYTLSIYSTFDLEQKEIKFIENLISLQVDGILIAPAEYRSRSVALIKKMAIPYVVLDRQIEDTGHDLVEVDNYQAAYRGTKHLIENGHRRIAFLGWRSRLPSITDRIRGFHDAVREAGIDDGEVAVHEAERDADAYRNLVRGILRDDRYTAYFVAYHPIGEELLRALYESGRRVPDSVSVLIYGNPIWAGLTNPGFTCIVQPDLEVGRKGAELIIDRLENPAHEARRYVLPTELLIRESIKRL